MAQITLANEELNNNPDTAPGDHWAVEEALAVLQQDQPDVLYILMGQLDEAQHAFGAIDVDDNGLPKPWIEGPGGEIIVNSRNKTVYKEPVLDTIWDVDQAFGKLITGIEQLEQYDDANIVLLSDHNMETFFANQQELTNVRDILEADGLDLPSNQLFIATVPGSYPVAGLYWQNPDDPTIQTAEDILGAYQLNNPETGDLETPWYILNRDDMISGRPELGIEPLELYNEYFVENLAWPDLYLFAKEGYSIIGDVSQSTSIPLPAGHGSFSTQEIMLAIQGLDFEEGTYSPDVSISDIGVTLMNYYGLPLPYDGLAGRDLHQYLDPDF